MGIFDFVKEAGEKLGFGKSDEEEAAEERVGENRKGMALRRLVTLLGLDVENLSVSFDDGVATVRGRVPNQAEKEKVVLAIGNTQGVARVDDRLEVGTPAPEAEFYTVKAGDSLSRIAKEHYGDANKYKAIFEANRPMLKDPDLIYPGQVLRIPDSP